MVSLFAYFVKIMKTLITQTSTTFYFLALSNSIFAQAPTGIPRPGQYEEVDFSSWTNILFYIGIPIFFYLFYKIWMKSKNKKNE